MGSSLALQAVQNYAVTPDIAEKVFEIVRHYGYEPAEVELVVISPSDIQIKKTIEVDASAGPT